MTKQAFSSFLLLAACSPIQQSWSLGTAPTSFANQQSTTNVINRRNVFNSIFASSVGTALFLPTYANAAEDNQVLSDEEMAARVRRKQELLRAKAGGGSAPVSATAVRSDVNPDAGVSLRSRSAVENAKLAMDKQKELKNRSKAQTREDLCEMLGRGC